MARLMHDDVITTGALTAAARAASAAGVEVRELADVREQAGAIDLLARVWKRTAENPAVPPELLRALSKAGSYVGGAFADGSLVGVAIAFYTDPERHALHSHITGISTELIGRSVGFALKLHQRAWALGRGIEAIEWTFDPLVARNAHFNLTKLGARPQEYLANFYGAISDGVNSDDETDRLLVSWALRDDEVAARAGGVRPDPEPRRVGDEYVRVPPDIEAIRGDDRAEARRWRVQVRDRLTALLDDGYRIIGFDRADGYVLRAHVDNGKDGS